MKSPRRRASRRDIAVVREVGYDGQFDALQALEEAVEAHVDAAHGGDRFAPSTFGCLRCAELEEADQRLIAEYFAEPGEEGNE